MKKTKNNAVVPEVVYSTESWKQPDMKMQLINLKTPSASLDSTGKIMFYHTLTMEAGKVSIAAALMTALELYKAKLDHPGTFIQWCESNLRHGDIKMSQTTVTKYLAVLHKTIGKGFNVDDLAHDTEKCKLEAVSAFTKYTNYQSLYQLYHGEEIVKASNLGGSGRGQGRKRKDAKELAEAAEAAAKTPELLKAELEGMMTELYRFAELERSFEYLDRKTVEETVKTLDKITKRARLALTNM